MQEIPSFRVPIYLLPWFSCCLKKICPLGHLYETNKLMETCQFEVFNTSFQGQHLSCAYYLLSYLLSILVKHSFSYWSNDMLTIQKWNLFLQQKKMSRNKTICIISLLPRSVDCDVTPSNLTRERTQTQLPNFTFISFLTTKRHCSFTTQLIRLAEKTPGRKTANFCVPHFHFHRLEQWVITFSCEIHNFILFARSVYSFTCNHISVFSLVSCEYQKLLKTSIINKMWQVWTLLYFCG